MTWVRRTDILGVGTILALSHVSPVFGQPIRRYVGTDAAEHEDTPTIPPPERGEPMTGIGADLVVGFGKYPLLLPTRVANAKTTWVSPGLAAVTVASLIVAGRYELGRSLTVGARFPLTVGTVPAADLEAQSEFSFGNLEVEAETVQPLAGSLRLRATVAVAVPSAQGDGTPSIDEDGELSSDYTRASLNQEAAFSRGGEVNALFATGRIGVTAGAVLQVPLGALVFAPFAKFENLIGIRGARQRYVGELVVGGLLDYALSANLKLVGRVWMVTSFEGETSTAVVAEPQLRLDVAPFVTTLGGILPFAGALVDPLYVGLRLSVWAHL